LQTIWNFYRDITAVAFSPDGQTLAVSTEAGWAYLVDIRDISNVVEKVQLKAPNCFSAADLSFSPDGKMLAVACGDDHVRVWDTTTYQQVVDPIKGHTQFVTSVEFSKDGTLLASGSHDDNIMITKVPSFKRDEILRGGSRGHRSGITALAFNPDSTILASGSQDTDVRLWDVSGSFARTTNILKGHTGPVMAVAFSPSGSIIASGCDMFSLSQDPANTLMLWDVKTGVNLLMRNMSAVSALAFSPDGGTLAVAVMAERVKLIDMTSPDFPVVGSYGTDVRGSRDYFSLAFSPDGKMLAVGRRHIIDMYELNYSS